MLLKSTACIQYISLSSPDTDERIAFVEEKENFFFFGTDTPDGSKAIYRKVPSPPSGTDAECMEN